MTAENLVGQRFGKLVVLVRVENKPTNKHAQWLCLCDCGNEKVVASHKLKGGEVKSCSCMQGNKTHGATKTTTYAIWQNMKIRCSHLERDKYNRYAGRGLEVCDRWQHSFENFLADMGERPEGMSLDRINNDKGYEPTNCRWATQKEQCRNTRRNRIVNTPQGKMLMADAVTASGLPYATIQYRLNHNWPTEKLFDKPI